MGAVKEFAAHPGIVEMIDAFTNHVERIPAETMPSDQAFVYLDAKGVATNDPEKAATRVPIVSIVSTPLDEENQVVPEADAIKVVLSYHGPDQKTLRTTTMTRGG